MLQGILHQVDQGLRIVAMTAFGAALTVLATQWAVRRKLLQPFGWWPRALRRLSDPALRPIERRLAAVGQNPQDAALWLVGVVAVAALLTITVFHWIVGAVQRLLEMGHAGPVAWLRLLVGAGTTLVMAAIVARVIGLWLGAGRYHRWMRIAYRLTDWIIEPIRRRLPPTGMLDLSPLVAYLLLLVLRIVLLG
jgi:YggT family protein